MSEEGLINKARNSGIQQEMLQTSFLLRSLIVYVTIGGQFINSLTQELTDNTNEE